MLGRLQEVVRLEREEEMARRSEADNVSVATAVKTGNRVFVGHGGDQTWREVKDFLVDRSHLEYEEFNREATAGISTAERRTHRNSDSNRTDPRREATPSLPPESESSSSMSDRLTTQPSRGRHQLKIVERRIEDIKPDPRNPRIHDRKQIRKLASAIREFGFNTPLLLGSAAKLLAGHARLEACKLLGLSEVLTISLEHLTELRLEHSSSATIV